MKRVHYDEDSGDASWEASSYDDTENASSYGVDNSSLLPGESVSEHGGNEPCLLTTATTPSTFDYLPMNPSATGNLTARISPFGCALDTLTYNLRHAIERRDESRMAVCLTELFRHFVFLNRHMTRMMSPQLNRQTQMKWRMAIGPFSNPVSLGMHQCLKVLLLGIAVRQIGVAVPTMISYVMKEWEEYERVLFNRPALALAKLLGIGTTLCHCKKDASVSYARFVFADTAKMREWRKELTTTPDILGTYLSDGDQASHAREMLTCCKIYFVSRSRLRKYQEACITTPHPEYMCQGGLMQPSNVSRLVKTIKQGIPQGSAPSASAVLQDVEAAMMYLSIHTNNMFDQDAHDNLQVDLQIFLYFFKRALCEEMGDGRTPGTLLQKSRMMVLSAANDIRENYALQLWVSRPNMSDFIKYGVLGEPAFRPSRGNKKRLLTLSDLVYTFQSTMVPKVHENTPPSIVRDHDNIPRECDISEIQQHPALHGFRFLLELYCLHYTWSRCRSTRLLVDRVSGTEHERIVIDREFVDLTQPHRVLYKCTTTGVAATEVRLQGRAATELVQHWEPPPREPSQATRIRTTDAGEAEILRDHLCEQGQARAHKALKAVLVGPFPLHEIQRLEEQLAHHHTLKETLHVQPNAAYVQKMAYVDFASVTGFGDQIVGRIYAWVVYVPSLTIQDSHVTMTIRELKAMSHQDVTLAAIARAVLSPGRIMGPVAVMKRLCEEYCRWGICDNYVSFDVNIHGSDIVLDNISCHTITETLLGEFPDTRCMVPGNAQTTWQEIQFFRDRCSAGGKKYQSALLMLARYELALCPDI